MGACHQFAEEGEGMWTLLASDRSEPGAGEEEEGERGGRGGGGGRSAGEICAVTTASEAW